MHSEHHFFSPLPTPQEMHTWDLLATSDFGIPPIVLMENASREALHTLTDLMPLRAKSRILIYIGKGNNGGDGIALGRHLVTLGHQVLVCHMHSLNLMEGEARQHLTIAQNIGVPFLQIKDSEFVLPSEWRFPDVIVDALCGTGLTGPLRQETINIVKEINSNRDHSFIFSLDIPSGLCGLSGKALPEAVCAHATVTFEAAKPGLVYPEAQAYTGKLIVKRIGIPALARQAKPASWQLLSPKQVSAPSPFLHKGTAGKVVVIGGSKRLEGAPFLSALGALRTGSGLVTVACPAALQGNIRKHTPEIMTYGLCPGDVWNDYAIAHLPTMMESLQPSALVIGPGMGQTPIVASLINQLVSDPTSCPLIIDADALGAISLGQKAGTDLASRLRQSDIITPHPGEMSRLLPYEFFPPQEAQNKTNYIQENRPETIGFLTKKLPCIVVLKGAGTLIGQQNSPTTISPFAEATLAVPGSGDVLSGIIAALCASKQYSSYEAAGLGVYMHAMAGHILAQKAPRGHLASEIANVIPDVLQTLCQPKVSL